MNDNKTLTLGEIKIVIANQLKAERAYGVSDRDMQMLETVTDDLIHLLSGRYIVNGVRI